MKILKAIIKKFKVCTSGLSIIDNGNIDKSCLNRSKLHLNRRGLSFFANNFNKFVNSLWKSNPFAEICQRTPEHPTNSLAELKFLRIRNHNNVIFSYLNINSIRNKFDNLKLIIDDMLISFVLQKPKLTTLFQLHSSVGLDTIGPIV